MALYSEKVMDHFILNRSTWEKSKLHLILFPSNLRGKNISAHIVVG